MVIFYHASVRNVKKIILSYIYMSSYVIAKMKKKKKKLFPDDVIDVDSAHERHFRTKSMTSIRRKMVK